MIAHRDYFERPNLAGEGQVRFGEQSAIQPGTFISPTCALKVANADCEVVDLWLPCVFDGRVRARHHAAVSSICPRRLRIGMFHLRTCAILQLCG